MISLLILMTQLFLTKYIIKKNWYFFYITNVVTILSIIAFDILQEKLINDRLFSEFFSCF